MLLTHFDPFPNMISEGYSAQKGFCKHLFYYHRGRRGTFVEPKAIRGQFVEWWASRKTDCNEIPETFAELRGRYFDALTS